MKKHPQRGRLTLRETIAKNQQALDYYATLTGKPRLVLNAPPEPKPRAPRQPSDKPLEAAVQAAVIDLLRQHPLVAWFLRVNSGVAVASNAQGEARYTAFYRLYVRGMKPTSSGLSDLVGQLTDGRLFLMECKRAGVRRGTEEQEGLIALVRGCGGVAGIVQSVDDAVELLGRI